MKEANHSSIFTYTMSYQSHSTALSTSLSPFRVSIHVQEKKGIHLNIHCEYVLLNKTGQPLLFSQVPLVSIQIKIRILNSFLSIQNWGLLRYVLASEGVTQNEGEANAVKISHSRENPAIGSLWMMSTLLL